MLSAGAARSRAAGTRCSCTICGATVAIHRAPLHKLDAPDQRERVTEGGGQQVRQRGGMVGEQVQRHRLRPTPRDPGPAGPARPRRRRRADRRPPPRKLVAVRRAMSEPVEATVRQLPVTTGADSSPTWRPHETEPAIRAGQRRAPGRSRTCDSRFRKSDEVTRCDRHQATPPSRSPSLPAVAAGASRGSSPNSSPRASAAFRKGGWAGTSSG
jgi:hypothetical protein